HVAALRLMEEDAAREEAEREWKRMLAVTVRAFRHEKIVADQQGRDHRSRRHRPPSARSRPNRPTCPALFFAARRSPSSPSHSRRAYSRGQSGCLAPCRDMGALQNAHSGPSAVPAMALMMTIAWARGYSSVKVRSICGDIPAGVISFRRASAPPVNAMLGLPPLRLMTPMSLQNTPRRRPVPSALEHASLAANRFA